MRKQKRKKRQGVIIVIMISVVFLIGLAFFNNSDNTSFASCKYERSIKSVLICEGDTLWGIAREYYTNLDGDFNDYVKEIYKTNQLDSDVIYTGNYIIVPYYVLENENY